MMRVSEHTPELSIVIPAYNASQYILRTLTSLEEQTVSPDRYRIIVVDDGSADDTMQLCIEFAENYSNIQVLHQENRGVSAARNTGIDASAGKWISFVDSDDYVDRCYVEAMLAAPESDYVIFDHFAEHPGNRAADKEWMRSCCERMHDISQVLLWICDNRLNTPWDKRFSLDVIQKHSIRFSPDVSMGEDLLFNFEYALHVSSAYVSGRAVYVYTDNSEGLCRRRISESRLREYETIYWIMQFACKEYGLDAVYGTVISLSFLRNIARCAGQLYISGFPVKRIAELFDESAMVRKVLAEPVTSFKDRIRKLLLKMRLYPVCAQVLKMK